MYHTTPVRALSSLLFVAAASWSTAARADDPPAPEVIATFDPDALEVPESIATDPAGNLYVSLALTGEVSRIAPSGEVETLAATVPDSAEATVTVDWFARVSGVAPSPFSV